MTSTALDLITRALRLLQVIEPGETPDDDDALDALATLNELVDSWATDGTTILSTPRTQCNLVSGQASYTIGAGGDFNQVRPATYDFKASVIPDRTVTNPLEIPFDRILTVPEYQGIPVKSLTARFPDRLFYDHAYTAGLGRFYPWPVPNASVAALVLYLPTPLSQFADLSTSYSFAPGFLKALRYNLALELAPDFEKEAPANVVRLASQSLAKIQNANTHLTPLRCDAMFLSRAPKSNIYTGN